MAAESYSSRWSALALVAGLVLAGALAGRAQTLAEALNATNLVWTTGGDASWLVQTNHTHDGVAAVQTPLLTSNQISWLETTVVGPGTMRVCCMAVYAKTAATSLIIFNDEDPQGMPYPQSGTWSENGIDLGVGTHVLRWTVTGRNQVETSAVIFLDEFAWDPPRPLTLIQGPSDDTVYSGGWEWLSAAAIGTPPIQFQWRRDGTNMPGATNAALHWVAVTTNDAGSYSVMVSNLQGSITSGDAILTVLPPTAPFFTAEPADTVAYIGASLNLLAGVDGSPAVCQWRKNGLDLPGWNESWLQITNVSLADAGSYTLFASNAWGSIESTNATVTVRESIAPTITRQPRSLEVVSGITTWMTVGISGKPDPAVFWNGPGIPIFSPREISVPMLGPNISSNESSYLFFAVTMNDTGVYYAEVSNSRGAVTSQAALLTVLPPIEQVGTNFRTAVAIYVTNGLAYLARGTNGFSILNVSDSAAPVWLGDGQISGSAVAIQVADGLAFIADGSAVEIFNVANPAAPVLLSRYLTGGSASDLVVRSNLVFVANGQAGLAILDVTNPAGPKLVGSYATNFCPNHVCLAGNFAYLTSPAPLQIINGTNNWVGGVLIVDVSNPARPIEVGRYGSQADDIAVSERDRVAFVDNSIVSLANLSQPAMLCFNFLLDPGIIYGGLIPYWPHYAPGSYRIVNDRLYLIGKSWLGDPFGTSFWTDGTSWVLVYDIREPDKPIAVGQFPLLGKGQTLWVDGQYVYIAGSDLPLVILKTPFTAEPELPPQLALTQPGGFKLQMKGHRGRHYAVEYSDGLTGLSWQPLQTVMLTNDTVTVPVSSSATSRFFRLRQLD